MSRRRPVLACLLAYAIALQAVLAVWAGTARAAVHVVDPASVLCTPSGEVGPARDNTPDHGRDCSCGPVCAVQAFALDVPDDAAVALLAPSARVLKPSTPVQTAVDAGLPHTHADARAPPRTI